MEKDKIEKTMRSLEDKIEKNKKYSDSKKTKKKYSFAERILREYRDRGIKYNGKILHLDGDSSYGYKSQKYYKELGMNAIVKNIPENEQADSVIRLLNRYKPDILVITGHDGMIKNGSNFNDIYNYRNSRHFIKTVREARKWGRTQKELVIFAGACQSYYEALIFSGADFASSPGRVLIDFLDPLVVACKVATTDDNKFITINEIAPELKEGTKGIGGIRTRGKRKEIT